MKTIKTIKSIKNVNLMKLIKNPYILSFILFIVIVIFYFLMKTMKTKEGYTTDNISTATSKLNEILTSNLEQLKTVINDLSNQKYQLSMNEVLNTLNAEYGPDSKLSSPENSSTDAYLKQQIKNINYLQSNFNNINKKIDSVFENVKVDMVDIVTEKIESYNLIDAINKISLDIKKTSNSLSQIPP
jgi:hypothetical protein